MPPPGISDSLMPEEFLEDLIRRFVEPKKIDHVVPTCWLNATMSAGRFKHLTD